MISIKQKNNQMPMRKDFTLVHSTQKNHYQEVSPSANMKPSETTIEKILQFAASYRVEKIKNDEFIEYFLN